MFYWHIKIRFSQSFQEETSLLQNFLFGFFLISGILGFFPLNFLPGTKTFTILALNLGSLLVPWKNLQPKPQLNPKEGKNSLILRRN